MLDSPAAFALCLLYLVWAPERMFYNKGCNITWLAELGDLVASYSVEDTGLMIDGSLATQIFYLGF